ncbi:MAG: GNAT family N-acetyltransferase, partial [Bacteroidales bacterium]|nr:GNAT family N-acetyltransferase [Bacteroidales bacterium]
LMMEFKRIQASIKLPAEWDALADNYFQQTKFLLHTEKYNPCQQRYYTCSENGKLISAAIVYSLRLDLLTFINIKSPVKMNITGIPCSVSSKGIFGDKAAVEALKKHICQVEKGFVLFLNLEDEPVKGCFASGKTLPTIVLKNNFDKWDDYLAALRSNYRRRLILLSKNNSDLRFERKSCSEFTYEMYRQYLAVYKRSSGKLEKLNCDFFKNLPPEFNLTICFKNETILGWNITLESPTVYYFFLGGIDYKQNKIHNTYLRLLSAIIEDGIEKKLKAIDLGQTAETPKMRLGGKPEIRYMQAHHHNRFLNNTLKSFSTLLEYKRKLENTHAMKERF